MEHAGLEPALPVLLRSGALPVELMFLSGGSGAAAPLVLPLHLFIYPPPTDEKGFCRMCYTAHIHGLWNMPDSNRLPFLK